jgi:hypothetical protein
VLVIIGLLLGGVLKGQELINNARVKSYAADFRNIPVYLYGYQDRYHALPGDDIAANVHVNGTNATTPAGTLGNGAIDGVWNTTLPTDESCLFWQHVRLANLATGSTTVNCAGGGGYVPLNVNGGIIGIQSNGAGFSTITLPTLMTGSFIICSANIPGQFVVQLDQMMDDGNPQTGSMRAVQQSAYAAHTATDIPTVMANPGDLFTVCMGV